MGTTVEENEKLAGKFMLQEHSRIIDAYYDLHVQKNNLIRVYLAFVSLPASIVVIFLSLYKFLPFPLPPDSAEQLLQSAGVSLSVLLLLVGIAVIQVMLKIRREQLLYVKTVNTSRQYFKDRCSIDPHYLVLPADRVNVEFGQEERWGRAFWEAMIVSFTNSLFISFLSFEGARQLGMAIICSVVFSAGIFIIIVISHAAFIKNRLQAGLKWLEVNDARFKATQPSVL